MWAAAVESALVDIGWNGTIQKFLHDRFFQVPDFLDMHDSYFAFVVAMHGDFVRGDRIDGCIQRSSWCPL